jgi:hypothetical protein
VARDEIEAASVEREPSTSLCRIDNREHVVVAGGGFDGVEIGDFARSRLGNAERDGHRRRSQRVGNAIEGHRAKLEPPLLLNDEGIGGRCEVDLGDDHLRTFGK